MKTVLLIVIVVVVLGVILAFTKKKFAATEAKVTVADIPAIFQKLEAATKDGSFAVFIFTPPGKSPADEAINLQFSIEGGRVGFDWVLLGPPNVRDKDRFVQFAAKSGYKLVEREMNDVRYLRVEEGNLPRLCEATIRDFYSFPPHANLDLIPEGFTWP